MIREIRTKMTLRDAITIYPNLLEDPVEIMDYPTDGYYPSTAIFQFIGDKNYRSNKVKRIDVGLPANK